MAIIVVNTFLREVRKNLAFTGLGFALGCYATHKYLDKIYDIQKNIETQNYTQNSQPYGLEKKVIE